jgi:hypothetical protein
MTKKDEHISHVGMICVPITCMVNLLMFQNKLALSSPVHQTHQHYQQCIFSTDCMPHYMKKEATSATSMLQDFLQPNHYYNH